MSVSVQIPEPGPSTPEVPGDPGQVDTFVDTLLRVASAADDLDSVAAARSTLEGWTGDAATAYGSYVTGAGTNAQSISLALRNLARAADTYSAELTRLRTERGFVLDDQQSYAESRSSLVTQVANAVPEDEAYLQELAAQLVGTRARLVERQDALVTACETNDRTMATALTQNADLPTFQRLNPNAIDPADAAVQRPGAPGTGASPEEVAQWWNGLTEEERYAVTVAYPELIGPADGVPATARDQANRALLGRDLETLERREEAGILTPEQERQLANARAAEEALGNEVGDPITREPVVPLLHLYDPTAWDGEGAIAIAYGNPDTADNIATVVPGTTTTGESAGSIAGDASNVYSSARVSDPNASTAAIAWIGYDTPEFDLSVTNEDLAQEGGDNLARYVDGLRAVREVEGNGQPDVTVIGHSYGSTTVANSATGSGLDADDIVLIGSPGAGRGVEHADELGGAQVWAGNASRDPVASLADNGWVGLGTWDQGLGNDVGEDDFGANRFRAESVDRGEGGAFADHSRYFDDGSESLHNIGNIVAGNDDDVTRAEHTYDPWNKGPQDPERDRDPEQLDDVVLDPDDIVRP
ncbi:alpha/beta hydrolase [Litorihabitans aurantiacus]|uniref:DUF1023 domain-containing protein n=1 Tax=Litorihabitans aurantiacus TaxID=1930061 RepID=A0AA38CV73_9MICO|nr:alpha/beta hydrolase [Litorihabitans aurantiacus]GMA32545.1 hypothetical protein GCM10025875_25370 [Litorihabitans aurantiacus]